MRARFVYFLPAICWLITSIILLTLPGNDIPQMPIFEILYFDKWVHIGMFGILTLLWGFPFLKYNIGAVKLFFLIALGVTAYGVAMEFVQRFFTYERSFDIFDIIADAVGALIGYLWLRMRWKKSRV